nr:hypothetical protein [Tanacetum cinerariifolium]
MSLSLVENVIVAGADNRPPMLDKTEYSSWASAAKLPILNPNEFDLWKMRIEQYFLMTDYSLWEVILNGDSPAPTRVIEGVLQPALPDKHQLKFNTHKDAKTLMEAIKKSFGGNTKTKKVECYNCHKKRHFTRECRSSKDTRRNDAAEPQMRNVPIETYTSNALVSQCDGVGSYDWSFQADEDPTNYALRAFTSLSSSSDNEARLLVYQQNESVFEEDIKLRKLEVQLRDNALVVLRQNLEKAEQERDHLKHKLEKFQTSFKNLSYNSQVFTRAMFDCDDYCTSESDESLPTSPIYDRYQSGNRYHVVPPLDTGTFMPPKPDLVYHNVPNDVETVHTTFNVKLSPTKPDQYMSPTNRPLAHIIEDWVSDSDDESETKPLQNVPSFVQSTEQVKSPRPSVQHVETFIPAANPKTSSPKPKCQGNSKNRKACFVCKSLDHLINDSIVPQSKLVSINVARPITADLPNIHGNPQHDLKDKGVIDSRGSRHMTWNMSYLADFEELNSGYVAFGGNPKGDDYSRLTWVFFLAIKDETSPILKTFIPGLENQLSLKGIKREFSVPRTLQQNSIAKRKNETLIEAARTMLADSLLPILFWAEAVNTACYVKNRVLVTKPPNKTPYELLHCRTPSIGFMIPFGCLVTILNTLDSLGKFDGKVDEGFLVGYSNTDGDAAFDEKELEFERRKPESEVNISPSSKFKDFSDNSINEDNAAGTIGPAVGPTHGKSSYVDSSQLLDDRNMPELEDITYSDDKDNVGAEVDFNNLETSITVTPIPTTRVHKDHPEELLQFKMQKVWVLLDLPHGKRAIGTKWVFRNKKDKRGIVVRNKARIVPQGQTQEEGIDYEEVFTPSAFLYETIEEDVYVCQPLRFEKLDYPDKVYKVVKELYRLHQAPRAWYETLANYLLENGFQRGKIDQTLFIK